MCAVAATNRVLLMAEPDNGQSLFRGWSGACTGRDVCIVHPPAQPVSATFVTCDVGLGTLTVKRPKKRKVAATFIASGGGTISISVTRAGKTLAKSAVTATGALQTIKLWLPKSAKKKEVVVHVSGTDACGTVRQLATKRV